MGTNSMTPQPPPGFELEQGSAQAAPPPPPGFEVEQGLSYWGDVKKNAIEGVKEIPAGAANAATTALRTADTFNPVSIGKSIFQRARGTPWDQTDTGKDIQAGADMVQGAGSTLRTWGRAAKAPVQMLSGTPMAQTDIGQQFRERPLSTTADAAAAAGVGRSMFGKVADVAAPANGAPNFMEKVGARGINKAAGIMPDTIEDLTKTGQNPGDVGVNLGSKLSDEGAIGSNATETFAKADVLKNQYGKAVQSALDRIKKANRGLGEYPELEDSLKIESTPLLKPILDNANELGKSSYPVDRFTARGWRAMYNSLSEKANANDGYLTLDHVTDELHKVGKMLNTAGENHIGVVKQLYGKLANMRDSMVNDIADQTMDQSLADDLRKANEGYSRYMRIMPDIERSSAKGAVEGPASFLRHPIDTGENLLSRGIYKTGKTARQLFSKSPGSAVVDTGRRLRPSKR